jgi:hypothetical protein
MLWLLLIETTEIALENSKEKSVISGPLNSVLGLQLKFVAGAEDVANEVAVKEFLVQSRNLRKALEEVEAAKKFRCKVDLL